MDRVGLLRRLVRRLRRGRPNPLLLAARLPQYQIGRGTYGDLSVLSFGESATLRVGAYSSFAKGVQVFLGGEHRMDWVTTYPFSAMDARFVSIEGHPRTRGDVSIGNDVWVGREAMIMSGVTVGDGAVIGARAVVTKDVPPYGIVAGNPATLVRHRFSPDVTARLLALAWWDWPEPRVTAAVPHLMSTDIVKFIEAAERGDL